MIVFILQKNGTAYTNYTMNTGIDTVKDIGKLYAWNNQRYGIFEMEVFIFFKSTNVIFLK